MKIVEKIKQIHSQIKDNPDDPALAQKMQELAVKAMYSGINHDDWKQYMSNFASSPEQLQRLIGKDEAFNNTKYGRLTLAYVVANSTCGMGTTTETGRDMSPGMLEALDSGLPAEETDIEEPTDEQNGDK